MFETELTFEVDEIFDELQESDASIAIDKDAMSYAKFIFTDSDKNVNKKRVGEEEFDNIVRTGLYKPFKMDTPRGQKLDHPNSKPIGTIIQLKKENNQVKGIAGLWKKEAEEEINYLKDSINKKILPQVSWELLYHESTKDVEGIEDLHGVIVKGVVCVSNPAYAGRTPILAVSSEQDTSNLEGKELEELEKLQLKVTELETLITEKDTVIASKDEEIKTLTDEKTELAEYKASIEAAHAAEEKFTSIKNKFKDAGLMFEDTYFDTNKEKLLSMDEASLDFHIQDLVAFASVRTSNSSIEVPSFVKNDNKSSKVDTSDPKNFVKMYRDATKKE